MQVVFYKKLIDNYWSSHPFSPVINRATVVAYHTHDHSCVAVPRMSGGLAFVTDDIA